MAAEAGLDMEAFLALARGAVDDVAALGAAAGSPGRPGGALGHPRAGTWPPCRGGASGPAARTARGSASPAGAAAAPVEASDAWTAKERGGKAKLSA